MSEKSVEILLGQLDTPQEMDNYEETIDLRYLMAFYESSTQDILDHMNTDMFRYVYNILKNDILDRSVTLHKIFIDKYLEKMVDVYEYEFAKNPVYDTDEKIEKFFKFIEFVEYDNVYFLKNVWKYLDDILSVKIRSYVQKNDKIIVDEITNQAELMTTLTENTSEFLRTYNKEGLLEWFIDRSERNKYEIYAENLE